MCFDKELEVQCCLRLVIRFFYEDYSAMWEQKTCFEHAVRCIWWVYHTCVYLSVQLYMYTVSQKIDPILKRYNSSQLYGSISLTFGRNIQKTLEFAFFSFHVGLLVITLSCLKLHTENNACILCASVGCWTCLLQNLRRRSLSVMRKTNDRWIPHLKEIFLTVRWLWGLSSWLSNSNSTVSTFSSVCALRLPLPGRLSTVPNFTSSLWMLFFVQPLFRKETLL